MEKQIFGPQKILSVDWNQLWNRRIRSYRQIHHGWDGDEQWAGREKALAYWRMALETQAERIEKTLGDLPVTTSSRVLDIGSGPGVLAIPLARKIKHVTAVDASDGMIAVLMENASAENLANIACVRKRWEDVSPERDLDGPYDVVLASLSLIMDDLSYSISKMEQVCRGFIYLYWFAGQASWECDYNILGDLLPAGKRTPQAAPKSELLLKALDQRGIAPNIEAFPYVHIDRFDSFNEAVDYFVFRYGIPADRRNTALRCRVLRMLEQQGDSFVMHSRANCLKIWWPVCAI